MSKCKIKIYVFNLSYWKEKKQPSLFYTPIKEHKHQETEDLRLTLPVGATFPYYCNGQVHVKAI